MVQEPIEDVSFMRREADFLCVIDLIRKVPSGDVVKILLKINLHPKQFAIMFEIFQRQYRVKHVFIWMICV